MAAGVLACCAVAGCTPWTVHESFDHRTDQPLAERNIVSGGRVGGDRAELDVVSGATTVTVASADLHGSLYRVSTPDNAAVAPTATQDGGIISVGLTSTGRSGPATLRILVSSGVDWRIRLDGGATEESVDLSHARLAELDFGAGASHIDAVLPRPHGTVPVTMSGGASSFQLHLPDGVPVRVRFTGGASSATVDGTVHQGIAGGTTIDGADWSGAADRYEIDNTAGVSDLTLDRRA